MKQRKYPKSEALLERGRLVTPLGAQTYSRSYRYFGSGSAPSYMERGLGSHVWDVDGHEYVDFILSLGAITIGYNNDEINTAIREQLEKGIVFSQPSPLSIDLAEKLIEIIPCAEMVRFVKNGSDATTAAVRLARAFTGRNMIIVCGYHGWQDWYIASTEQRSGIPEGVIQDTKSCIYNDLDSIETIFKQHPEKVAAVIIEPVQDDGPRPGYLQGVKEMAHRNSALLIFDEILSGFRVGLGGAQERYRVVPDLSAFGKGMANGMPLSCVVGRKDIVKQIETDVFISTTFGDEVLSMAAALKTLELLQRPGSLERIWHLGSMWKSGIEALVKDKGLESCARVTGLPPHCGVEFRSTDEISSDDLHSVYQQQLLKNGVLSLGINNFCLAHTEEEIKRFIDGAGEAFDDLCQAITEKSVDGVLVGGKVDPIFKRN